jgi:hypothetical protein
MRLQSGLWGLTTFPVSGYSAGIKKGSLEEKMNYTVGIHTGVQVSCIAYSYYYYLFLIPRELPPISMKG